MDSDVTGNFMDVSLAKKLSLSSESLSSPLFVYGLG